MSVEAAMSAVVASAPAVTSPFASYVILVFVAHVIAAFSSTFASRAVCVAVETGREATVQSFVALLAETSANSIKSALSIVQSGTPVGNITSLMVDLVK